MQTLHSFTGSVVLVAALAAVASICRLQLGAWTDCTLYFLTFLD